MIAFTHFDSPLGRLLLLAEDGALVGLYYPDHLRGRAPTDDGAVDGGTVDGGTADHRVFDAARDQLGEYLAGGRRRFDLSVTAAGTPFQQRVWAAMRDIGYGEVATYGDLARAVGRPGAARAVGSAVARNPVSIVLPCHRVVGSTGRLTGYAGGTDRKRHLLDLEAAAVAGRGRTAGSGLLSEPAPTG